MQTQLRTKKLTLSAVLVALGIGLQIVESMIPIPINLPGGKLGLANIVTVILLYTFDKKTAIMCAVLRAFLGSVLYGGVTGAIYSVSGALFAAVMMIFAMHVGKNALTEVGVSIVGAVCHNIAQIFVASILLSNVWIYTYLPILGIAACITGIFTGYAAQYGIHYLQKNGMCDK